MSLQFKIPLLQRNPSNVQEGYPLKDYARREKTFRELMLDSNRVGLTLTVDQLLNARMMAAPETIKVNGATDCYLTNACNDSLSVVRVEGHAIKHWVGVAPGATLMETDWASMAAQ